MKLRYLVVLLVLIHLPFGKYSAATPPPSRDGETLRILLASSVRSPDPHHYFTVYSEAVFSYVFDRLVRLDQDGDVCPDLAVSWSQASPKRYRFQLRPDVLFHDGSRLDAHDVVFSLLRPLRLAETEIQVHVGGIRTVRALDDRTVEVELEASDPLFLKRLSFVAILPSNSPEPITQPIGTGPYRWLDLDDSEVLLEAFPDYWGPPTHYRRLHLDGVGDPRHRLELLLSGDADIVDQLEAAHAEVVEADRDLWVDSRIGLSVTYLAFNLNKVWLQRPEVRQAIDLALDRQNLVSDYFLNYSRAASQLASPPSDGYASDLEPTKRDLQQARQLLAQATPATGVPKLVLLTTASRRSLCQRLIAQLQEAGFEIDLQAVSFAEMSDRLAAGDYDLNIMGWGNIIGDLIDIHRQLLHSPDPRRHLGTFNRHGPSDPELDRRIVEAMVIFDAEKRQVAARDLSLYVREHHLILPLFWHMSLYGTRRELDFQPRVDGIIAPSTLGSLDTSAGRSRATPRRGRR